MKKNSNTLKIELSDSEKREICGGSWLSYIACFLLGSEAKDAYNNRDNPFYASSGGMGMKQ